MLVFCGDEEPSFLFLSDWPTIEVVHISWARILEPTPGTSVDFCINPLDIHYRLYQDCVRHLKTKHPPPSIPTNCSLLDTIFEKGNGLLRLPECFGTLVTLLADRYSVGDLHSIPVEWGNIRLDRESMLDFIAAGAFATTVPEEYHVTCGLPRSGGKVDVSDVHLYQALVLDVLRLFWRSECIRRTLTNKWSPMPWSKASVHEQPGSRLLFGKEDYIQPTATLHPCTTADCPCVTAHGSTFGIPVDIPWFGAAHDGYPFSPTLGGYTWIRRTGNIRSMRSDAALWVTTMIFGLYEAVTRMRIPEAMFLEQRPSDGQTVISGTRILRFLVELQTTLYQDYLQRGECEARLEIGRAIASLLHRALNALDEEAWINSSAFARAGYSKDYIADIIGAVTLAIVPLCGVVYCMWAVLPEMEGLRESFRSKGGRQFHFVAVSFAKKMMREAGWCPHTISESFMNLWDIPRLSQFLQVPPIVRNDPTEHRKCTEEACVFYAIDPRTYAIRHVNPSCKCAYIKPSLDEVVGLLSKGIVPAVVYEGDHLRVCPAEDGTYVAISHVWADGLGSTAEVGLPTCQVARIASHTRNLAPESLGAFWMDSLCIPDLSSYRKHAIRLMGNTYRDAAKVLVFDECIRLRCAKSNSWQENIFYMEISGWVRRVWTLQEGILARQLYFEFIEGPVGIEEDLGMETSDGSLDAGKSRHDPLLWLYAPESSPHLPLLSVREELRGGKRSKLQLGEVIDLLRLRSTSKPEDEIIAVSGLLPLDVNLLLLITGPDAAERRMKACLMQMQEVSKSLPMYSRPRLRLPGYRWAPRSLASAVDKHRIRPGDTSAAVCTEDGLSASYIVAFFHEPIQFEITPSSGNPWHTGTFFLVTHPETKTNFMLQVHIFTDSSMTQSELWGSKQIVGLLFISRDQLVTHVHRTIACAAVCSDGEPSSLLESPGVLRMSYICSCILDRISLDPESFGTKGMHVLGDLHERDVLLC